MRDEPDGYCKLCGEPIWRRDDEVPVESEFIDGEFCNLSHLAQAECKLYLSTYKLLDQVEGLCIDEDAPTLVEVEGRTWTVTGAHEANGALKLTTEETDEALVEAAPWREK